MAERDKTKQTKQKVTKKNKVQKNFKNLKTMNKTKIFFNQTKIKKKHLTSQILFYKFCLKFKLGFEFQRKLEFIFLANKATKAEYFESLATSGIEQSLKKLLL